eukprot:jgi/Pico_ML_1/54958/g91.t2
MPSSPMFSTLSTPLNGELRPMTCTSAVYTGPPSFLRSCAGATRDSSSAMASTEYPAAHKLPVSAPALVPMTPCTSTFRLSITASKNPT